MQYFCERDLELVRFDNLVLSKKDREEIPKKLENQDYNCFSQDQIVIKDDTIYMIVY